MQALTSPALYRGLGILRPLFLSWRNYRVLVVRLTKALLGSSEAIIMRFRDSSEPLVDSILRPVLTSPALYRGLGILRPLFLSWRSWLVLVVRLTKALLGSSEAIIMRFRDSSRRSIRSTQALARTLPLS